jgi:hypothetical protein
VLELPDPAARGRDGPAALASDDLSYVGVDVDPNEQVDAPRPTEEQGFDWIVRRASKDVA